METSNEARTADPVPTSASQTPRLWLAYLTVVLMPLCFNIGPLLHPQKKPINLTPLDPLLVLWALILMWDLIRRRAPNAFPPLPNLCWAGLALLSLTWAGFSEWKSWARTAVLQTTFVGLFGVWIFQNIHSMANCQNIRRRLALLLGASGGACFLLALYQYVQPDVTVFRVSGWYEIRGHLAPLVAMLVPAACAFAVVDRDPAIKAVAAAVALLGLCCCLSGGGVIAACAGVLSIAAMLVAETASRGPHPQAESTDPSLYRWEQTRRATLLVTTTALIVLVVLPMLPRNNPQVLWQSVTLYGEVDASEPEEPTANLRRRQAVLNLLIEDKQWKWGVGSGQFQHSVNQFYAPPYIKPGARTDDESAFGMEADEPYTFGLFETTAVELGLAGIIALLWVFGYWVLSAAAAYFRSDPDNTASRALALAALGSGVGALVMSLFGNPMVRGCSGALAFFMGLALSLNNARSSGAERGSQD